MAEDIHIIQGSKEEQYLGLLPQIEALLQGETDLMANMANFCAVLKEQFGFFWVGFYLVKGNELVLGPFQGPVACTRILKGKGVCGKAWEQGKTLIVPDVNAFPGHIACSSLSQSEIVIPVYKKGIADRHEIAAVLDVDSLSKDDFDEIDKEYLERLSALLFATS